MVLQRWPAAITGGSSSLILSGKRKVKRKQVTRSYLIITNKMKYFLPNFPEVQKQTECVSECIY